MQTSKTATCGHKFKGAFVATSYEQNGCEVCNLMKAICLKDLTCTNFWFQRNICGFLIRYTVHDSTQGACNHLTTYKLWASRKAILTCTVNYFKQWIFPTPTIFNSLLWRFAFQWYCCNFSLNSNLKKKKKGYFTQQAWSFAAIHMWSTFHCSFPSFGAKFAVDKLHLYCIFILFQCSDPQELLLP